MKITSLEYAGKARLNALGSTILRIIVAAVMPQARAASTSPRGVVSIAPRRISVVYAAVLRVNTNNAHQ